MNNDTCIVYVVDDDASVRKGLKRLLQASGFEVLCYASAAEYLNNDDRSRAARRRDARHQRA
jgi:FixJ family two-component response regulator